jgi:uncharacterized protein
MSHSNLIVLQPTSFCNIDCSYCYLPHRHLKAQMSVATASAVFERAMTSSLIGDPISFLWHLGEPLVAPRQFYEECFERCSTLSQELKRQTTHSFQTNGILLDDEWAKLFARHNVSVGVSVDGPRHLHDVARKTRSGHGTWDQVMAGIKFLKVHGVPFSTISVIRSEALDSADEIMDFFDEHEIYDIAFNIDEKEGINTTSSFDGPNAIERYKKFLSRVIERINISGGKFKVREVWVMTRSILLGSHTPANNTNVPFRIINVLSNGDFATYCPELITASAVGSRSFIIGNVHTASFDDAAAGERLSTLRAEIERGVAQCRASCEYFQVCGGGSPANKFFETGSFDVSETLCCRVQIKATADVVAEHMRREVADWPISPARAD